MVVLRKSPVGVFPAEESFSFFPPNLAGRRARVPFCGTDVFHLFIYIYINEAMKDSVENTPDNI